MIDDSFSLMHGGLVHRALKRMHLLHHGRTTAFVAIALTALAVVPLLVATAMAGTLWSGVTIPLARDYATLVRFAICVPLLVLVAPRADQLLRHAIAHFQISGLVPAGTRHRFDEVLVSIGRLRDSMLPEAICLAIALLPSVVHGIPLGSVVGVSDWILLPDGSLTNAGRWLDLVSTPIFRFVALIWIWRLLLWTWLLWRVSRIGLALHPAHPDGAAGLGFLAIAQYRFTVLPFVGGLLLAGSCINKIEYAHATMLSLRMLMAGYIGLATLLMVAPLLVLSPLLFRAKRVGLMRYGTLGHGMLTRFDARWLGPTASDETALLDAPDSSAVTDFTSVFGTIRDMSVIPLTRFNLAWLVLAPTLPLIPVLFFAMPIDQLVTRIVHVLA